MTPNRSEQSMLASLEKMSVSIVVGGQLVSVVSSQVVLQFIGRCPHWQNSSDGDVYAMAV